MSGRPTGAHCARAFPAPQPQADSRRRRRAPRGLRLGSVVTLDGVIGATRRALTHWDDCGGSQSCIDSNPSRSTFDFGAMLQAHTNPLRLVG